MKYISVELERVATDLGIAYLRAASLDDSNILTHYQGITGQVIIYTGFGAVNNYFEGAQPLQAVETEVYILQLLPTKDALAETKDDLLAQTAATAGAIIADFATERDTLDYTLEPIIINDDLLIGQLLNFTPIIQGNGCKI